MKIIVCLAIIMLLSASFYADKTFAQKQKPAFFLSLEDIPLMSGLEEIPAATHSLDKPEGRIIESYAAMENVTSHQVSQYYAQALPAFGWGQTAKNKFFRENEYLEISFETHKGQEFTKITIRPSL